MAVDGVPLRMDAKVSMPKPQPQQSQKYVDDVLARGLQDVEFPLRHAVAETNTTVFTNHFAIKMDPEVPLYEYAITGLPERMNPIFRKTLVLEMIDTLPFLRANPDKFATDYRKVISWVKIDSENLGPVKISEATEYRDELRIGLESRGVVNTQLLTDFAEGNSSPTSVRSVHPEVRHGTNTTAGGSARRSPGRGRAQHGLLCGAEQRLIFSQSK
jgi:eukaryotic translation initiation factor 2C